MYLRRQLLKDAAKQIAAGKDPHARKDGDSDAVADWRSRMGTEAAKLIYRLRGPTAELVNGNAATAGFGTCRCAADRAVALWDCSTQSLIIWSWWKDCALPRRSSRFNSPFCEKG